MEKNITKNGADTVNSLRHRLDHLRASTDRAYHVSEDFIRRYPLYSVLGAIALGAVIGSAFRRR